MRSLSLSSGTAYCPLEFRNKCTYYKIASFGNSNMGVKSHEKERERWVNVKRRVRVMVSGSGSGSGPELTTQNVDLALEEMRPYLIADGGNVQVSSVDNGIITLQLEGACGSCPSSTTTMKMGIERVLKEKFGDAIKDIRQANEQVNETTVEAVNSHLDILRPAIKNYGGEVDVIAIDGGDCTVKYKGPDTIGSGIKAAIKEKFPEISNVIFTS